MGLLEKFRNKPFPDWMRSMKAAEQIEKEQGEVCENMKNIPPLYDWTQIRHVPVINYDKANQDMSRTTLRRSSGHFATLPGLQMPETMVRAELQNFLKNPLKLKLSVSLKRKLRREKAKYQQVRQWMDEVEKAVNEVVFGNPGDER